MNEELQSALAKIIETTIQAKDFCLEQAPDIINQLLVWKFAESLSFFLIGIALILSAFIVVKSTYKAFIKHDADANIHTVGGLVASIITPFAGVCFLDLGGLAWLQICIAPKVYLLEYASNLIG